MMERNSSSSTSADTGNSTAFQRWLKKAAVLTGIGITPEERQRGFEDEQHVRCEKWKTELMNYSPSFSPCPRVHAHVFCLRIGVHSAREYDPPRPVGGVYAQASSSFGLRRTSREYYVCPVRYYAFRRVPSGRCNCTMPKPSQQQAPDGGYPDPRAGAHV